MSPPIDPSLSRTRLSETVAWCGPRASAANPRDCLRTAAVLPPTALREPEFRLPHQPTAVEATVSAVGRARAALLLVEGAQPLPLISSLNGGRLVAYDPESNLADGCAATESSGFVDVNNAPPWDTWICYVRERDETGPWQPFDRYLVSWVPPQLLEHAERAIWINPEECILWLEDLDTRISRALQSCFSLSETLVEGDAG